MQSMAWFGLTIVAIVGYNCGISFESTNEDFGHVLKVTLYEMYFKGKIFIKTGCLKIKENSKKQSQVIVTSQDIRRLIFKQLKRLMETW
jgi:hypothetical protein